MQVIGVVYNLSPNIEYYNIDADVKVGDSCLVNSQRGLEFCRVVEINSNNTSEYKVVRAANADDIKTNLENIKLGDGVKARIREIAKNFNLKMRICKCEYTFDREKLIVHYTADDRVDFRDLVKSLATEFKTRIEMHQINSRDETQLMGGLGCCGRVCCCKNHLCDFDKVSIKMAKKQGLSLNPQKLNGICGKLMCCLRYEDDFYTEALAKMPKVNERVMTPDGEGNVRSIDCLKEQVEVFITKGDEFERKTYPLEAIKFSTVKNKDE